MIQFYRMNLINKQMKKWTKQNEETNKQKSMHMHDKIGARYDMVYMYIQNREMANIYIYPCMRTHADSSVS